MNVHHFDLQPRDNMCTWYQVQQYYCCLAAGAGARTIVGGRQSLSACFSCTFSRCLPLKTNFMPISKGLKCSSSAAVYYCEMPRCHTRETTNKHRMIDIMSGVDVGIFCPTSSFPIPLPHGGSRATFPIPFPSQYLMQLCPILVFFCRLLFSRVSCSCAQHPFLCVSHFPAI